MTYIFADVRTPYELGKKYVEIQVPKIELHIANNIDYEALGLNLQNDQNGSFTDEGYVFEEEK